MQSPPPADPKFRLASELREQINLEEITDKILKMPINLELRELLGTSDAISAYFIENIRKRRRPITAAATGNTADVSNVCSETIPEPALVNSATVSTPFYACASPRAEAYVNDVLKVDALVDHGSEICLMPKRVSDQLGLYVDSNIAWNINTFDTGSKAEPRGPLGVCHRVSIDVGGVTVRIPVFIVEESNTDLLLGQPWNRIVRSTTINEDDGSCTIHIKSPDGRVETQFCAVKAEHERNRQFAKHPEEGAVGSGWGKV